MPVPQFNGAVPLTAMSVLLSQLLPALEALWIDPPDLAGDPLIQGVVMDSRQVQPGSVFVAVSGGSADGHAYIPAAVQRGAAAVVGTQPMPGLLLPYIQVRDSRRALARLAAAFHSYPARRMTMIGVTGTDGKTTTCNLIHAILQAAGLRAGMISTVNAVIGDQTLDTGFHVTTPDAPMVQEYLARMAAAGLSHVVLEATSHGLAQERVEACDFDLAAVTNITHEHLDYHGSYEAYRAAKGRLFTYLAETPAKPFNPPRGAVLNRDDASYEFLAALTSATQLSYGLDEAAQVRAQDVTWRTDGLEFTALGRDRQGAAFHIPIFSRLAGGFNVSNCLAAIALTRGLMLLADEAVARGIAALPGVPGRMERIDLGQPFTALVDFAHTPNALRRALEAARQMTQGRVIAVFGSAGLRDRQKRRMMAETAAELADLSILTAEDPRTESLDAILAEMAAGMDSRGGREGQTYWRIPHRPDAIRFALRLALPGDLALSCGKGHEQSMCFGETEYAWDDRTAMRAALAELLGQPGPPMPYLPAG